MCLIVFAWRPGESLPLVLAANRDEFYDRPSLPLAAWDDVPGVYAGRDLQAGGTWLGLGANGRFAALTNIRDPRQPPHGRSRGELPLLFLRGKQSLTDFMAAAAARAEEYSGFNLLAGEGDQHWHLKPRSGAPQALAPGLYGLSNADLDTPWPKVEKGKALLQQGLPNPELTELIELLHDDGQPADAELPDTGIGLDAERMLSGIFIATRTYGTRASTALIMHADGRREVLERSYGPYGEPIGEVGLRLPEPSARRQAIERWVARGETEHS